MRVFCQGSQANPYYGKGIMLGNHGALDHGGMVPGSGHSSMHKLADGTCVGLIINCDINRVDKMRFDDALTTGLIRSLSKLPQELVDLYAQN
jgi:hypothetical protein